MHAFTAAAGRPPGLGIVLVGDDPGSEIYVRNKVRAGTESGLWVDLQRLPATASLDELLALVRAAQRAATCTTASWSSRRCRRRWARARRSRCSTRSTRTRTSTAFNPVNVGRLVQGRAVLAPCTPSGVIEMLDRSGIAIAGTRAVVVGRSEIVGKPMAMLLLQRDATVTICHSKTPDLAALCRDGRHPGRRDRPPGS